MNSEEKIMSEIAVLRAYLKRRLDHIESMLEGKPVDSSDTEETDIEDVGTAQE